jgi:HAD superfamily hydrolase (TIGR01549 family)
VRAGALLFDFGGTLDADGIPWARRFHAAYHAAGGALPFAEFEPHFQASDRVLEALPEIRTLGFEETVRRQAELLCAALPDGSRIDAEGLARVFHADAARTARRNRAIVARLATRYRLGIVSNFTGNLEPCLRELGLFELFDAVSDSAVVGVQKPAPEIFAVTLAALGVAPEGAWMIGDNFEADVRGAAALGIRTCWLAPAERAVPEQGIATRRVASFMNIEDVVG